MRNYVRDPQLGEGEAEGVWMAACTIATKLERLQSRYPNDTRAEIVNRFHVQRTREQNAAELLKGNADKTEDAAEADEVTPKAKRAGTVGSAGGRRVWERLTTEPFLLEMMLDTKAVRFVYDSMLNQKQTTSLLHAGSGSFGANLWLSMRTLLKASHLSFGSQLSALTSNFRYLLCQTRLCSQSSCGSSRKQD